MRSLRAATRVYARSLHTRDQLRADFQSSGFAVVKNFLDPVALASLRAGVKKGVEERHEDFLGCPRAIDVFKQQRDTDPDPAYSKFVKKFKEVSKRKAQLRKHKRAARKQAAAAAAAAAAAGGSSTDSGDAPPSSAPAAAPPSAPQPTKLAREATKDDVWEMSKKIAAQLVTTPATVSTVYNDPPRLKAINTHKCNVWMTNDTVKQHVFGPVGKAIGKLATQVAGIEDPILFGDRPMVRDGFFKPTLLHCAAPFMGVYRHDTPIPERDGMRPLTCMVWVFLDDCAPLRSPLWTLDGSHRHVATELRKGVRGGVDVRHLTNLYPPVDSDLSLWLQKFPGLQNGVASTHLISAGSALVVDSHLLVSLGPNFGKAPHVSLQCLIASKQAKPSIHPASWIREWKSTSKLVDFKNHVIFPALC